MDTLEARHSDNGCDVATKGQWCKHPAFWVIVSNGWDGTEHYEVERTSLVCKCHLDTALAIVEDTLSGVFHHIERY